VLGEVDISNGSMNGFFSYQELWTEIDMLMMLHPDILISKFSIGSTPKGRDINVIQIADITGTPLDERGEIMITGGTHSRELVSVSYCLFIIKTLVTEPTPEQKYLLKTRVIWLIPVLNVDGYSHISDYYLTNHHLLQVRKNLHGNYK